MSELPEQSVFELPVYYAAGTVFDSENHPVCDMYGIRRVTEADEIVRAVNSFHDLMQACQAVLDNNFAAKEMCRLALERAKLKK